MKDCLNFFHAHSVNVAWVYLLFYAQTDAHTQGRCKWENATVWWLKAQPDLSPLIPGSRVNVQNEASKKCDRAGHVMKVLPHRQYTIGLAVNMLCQYNFLYFFVGNFLPLT